MCRRTTSLLVVRRAEVVRFVLASVAWLPFGCDGSAAPAESAMPPDAGPSPSTGEEQTMGGRGGAKDSVSPSGVPGEAADEEPSRGGSSEGGGGSGAGPNGDLGGRGPGAASAGDAGNPPTASGDAGTAPASDLCSASNVDVPVAILSGTITPPLGTAFLRSGNDEVPIVSEADGSFLVRVVPGTYDVVAEDPVAGAIVLERDLVVASESGAVRDLAVPSRVPLRGEVLVNGVPIQGILELSIENGTGARSIYTQEGAFEVEVSPGQYDIFLVSQFNEIEGPDNQHAKLSSVTVGPTGATVAVDMPAVGLSGTLSAPGVPAIAEPELNEIIADVTLVGDDGDRVPLGYLPKPDYAVQVVPGSYDLYVEGTRLRSVVIESTTVLDIVVPTGTVTLVPPEGFDGPPYGYGQLRDVSTGREYQLSAEADSTVIPVGTYELVYRGPLVSGVPPNAEAGWPRTQSVVLETGIVVEDSATTVLDLDVPSALLQGTITLGGEQLADVDANPNLARQGWMFLRGETSDVEISLDTADGTYVIPLFPGSYDLFYRYVGDEFVNTPQNALAKLESGIVVAPTGTRHDIDIPVALLTGKFTIGGKERPELDGYGRFSLVTEASSHTISVRADGTFALPVVGGTYDLYYESLLSGREAPRNARAKLQSGLVLPNGPVELDIDVPVATASGALTVAGRSIEELADDGEFTLRDQNGDTTTLGLLSLGNYEIALLPGSYEVFYTSTRSDEFAPLNSNARVGCLVVE